MLKEISLGFLLAFLVFLAIAGYDIIPLMVILAALAAMFYFVRSKGLLSGNFETTVASLSRPEVAFSDIGGQNAAINELREALDFIKSFDKIKEMGIRPLKGILLTGPPGTGKTLLAKAAANYTDSAFLAASGSEFIEMYAGVGAQRVRKLFQSAREAALKMKKNNAVIFIDEIEVLGGKRGSTSSHMEYDQTINQLLCEMDGMKVDDRVRLLVLAATNRADMLDTALTRPGRFDRQVKVHLPDKDGRLEILKLHTGNKPLAEDVCLDSVAKECFGFSGAHLESMANEAAILAMREGSKAISYCHFLEAVDKVMMGAKLDRKPSASELKRVAFHETGHAVIGEMVRPGSVSTVTITPRGDALGYIRQTDENDSYMYTKDYLEDRIAVTLAGAVAEELMLGHRSTGAANDFEHAVQAANTIIRSGMSELGVVSLEDIPKDLKHKVLTSIIREQENRVREYLEQSKDLLLQIVDVLLDKEKITGDYLRRVVRAKAA
ncbi:Adenosinetriphosphatase [Desulfofarcimen acetoxidans DSM 771]|uniref:Adenosinetriphosphatase n=1 Tax=Desulfofarcimen acetoxidans (strain ATCC 49208 / DSM 771 / KCTC 5769 / VKM B-1644 / 5575) TaxID=485916 RepID=C8W3S2_DESAS|nr:AAA family ATPase [Desulfofarcimen acetoxidans]ACV63858.1 Adenosinetriphosphatase [Desulfofarcimen acetoxidans DSM 771]